VRAVGRRDHDDVDLPGAGPERVGVVDRLGSRVLGGQLRPAGGVARDDERERSAGVAAMNGAWKLAPATP
jgi:hypothetical protein